MISCGAPAEETTTDTSKDSAVQVVEVKTPAVQPSFYIESGIVGNFKIGQPMPELPEGLNSRKSSVDVTLNGIKESHLMYVIYNSLEDIAEITMEKDEATDESDLTVIRMKAISNYYETRDNLEVGSTLTELTEKYPDTKIWYDGATQQIVAEASDLISVRFVFDTADCTKKLSGSYDINLSKKNFSETAKIIAVLVF